MMSAEDFRDLPLVHGSIYLHKIWSAVKEQGLIAGGGKAVGINTFCFDVAMERHKYIFLGTIGRYDGYGMGDYVLIHPQIIQHQSCVCFMNDPGKIFDQLRHCWTPSRKEFLNNVELVDDESFAVIISDIESEIDQGLDDFEWARTLKLLVYESKEIRQCYENLSVTPDTMFERLQFECNARNWTMQDYINRRRFDWPFSEEVLIRSSVEPEFILGRVDGRKWLPNPSARPFENLWVYLDLLEVA